MNHTKRHRSVRQIAEQHVEQWERSQHAASPHHREPVVAVSWQVGSRGRDIGQALAERLAYSLHEEAIVQEIARRAHTSASKVATMDERPRSSLVEWLLLADGLAPLSAQEYGRLLVRVIRTIERSGAAVILGHGAVYSLTARNHVAGLLLPGIPRTPGDWLTADGSSLSVRRRRNALSPMSIGASVSRLTSLYLILATTIDGILGFSSRLARGPRRGIVAHAGQPALLVQFVGDWGNPRLHPARGRCDEPRGRR